MNAKNTLLVVGLFTIIILMTNLTCLHSDTIYLNNGGKIKCQEVIKNEEGAICKFGGSQLIVQKENIKEIVHEQTDELPQKTPSKNQETSSHKPPEAQSKTSPPASNEKQIQQLENNYAQNKTDDSKELLLSAYQNEVNSFLIANNYKKSLEYALKIEKLDPADAETKLKIAICYYRLSDFFMAEYKARDAKKLNEKMAEPYFLLGDIYYQKNDLKNALNEWEAGLKIKMNPEYDAKLKELTKELKLSNDQEKTHTSHFKMNFDGNVLNNSATDPIVNVLEDYYKELSQTMNYYSSEPVTVIFYSNKDFKDLLNGPEWGAGVYDGKIRIPGKTLNIDTRLSSTLKHELTHAIITKKTNGNAPGWLQEGLASYFDGEKVAHPHFFSKLPDIAAFPDSFSSFDSATAGLLYEKSLSFINFLQEQYGTWKIPELLDALGDGKKIDDAIHSVYHQDLIELEQQWKTHLQDTKSN